jgi:uncharacterized protein (DUF1697 family)
MAVIISLLRGVNVGGHHKIKMDTVRQLYESLGLTKVQTYVQSGNVVFQSRERNLARLAARIEDAIENSAGFRPAVVLRTQNELERVIARNPFGQRKDLDFAKLLVLFLAGDPGEEARNKARAIVIGPEEMALDGREMFVYFPNGMGQSKFPFLALERALQVKNTARNWNTVTKLLEIAGRLN